MDSCHKTDTTLLDELRLGSWEAFEELYERYWEKIFLVSRSFTKDEELSKDFVQEIFLDLWNRREKLQIKNLYAYLYQASKYRLMDHIRKLEQQEHFIDEFNHILVDSPIEDLLHYKELDARIKECLEALSPKCKRIFYLSRYDHLSNQEIAQQLKISKSTVENQINKALNHLRNSPEVKMAFIIAASLADTF
ncbi:RNA polymerase sigma-70 factor [Echinicola strongylocentroti]|uniref:RNA polymerase sigma-70 factor n=1 Tax=Echinicola strongylocentroti TaxID=1795355 RepID=A0A2Z4ID84_9BACT|nr:RNA polymerase sigma-70 factor [Echinicola strongylocentroti]AWW28770.1 RNA polymerase sigma-70 factor [Echinicola strongylocentroti]